MFLGLTTHSRHRQVSSILARALSSLSTQASASGSHSSSCQTQEPPSSSPRLHSVFFKRLGHSMADTSAPAKPSHHIGNTSGAARFLNPWLSEWTEKSLFEVFRWQQARKKLGVSMDGWLEGIPYPKTEDFTRAFPLLVPDQAALAAPPADAIQAHWVGHATVLVQMAGLKFITDPIFSTRCSPVQWFGMKRVVPAAMQADDPGLKDLDFVLISHNHYDHLDDTSVKCLNKRFGNNLTWYVPLGVKEWFESRGMSQNVVELDWWQEVKHKDTKTSVIMVPAMHWSARGLMDRRHSLWGGYVVKSKAPAQTFYFAGDTGYCEVFKEIGERLGPMDLSAIPTGAYSPRWFMKSQHVDAAEGLQIHRDVKSKRSLAIHCCTWQLTDEALDEPPRLLAEELANTKGDPGEFITLQHGEKLVVRDGQTLNQPKLLPLPLVPGQQTQSGKVDGDQQP